MTAAKTKPVPDVPQAQVPDVLAMPEKPVLDFTQLAPTRRMIRIPTGRNPEKGEVVTLRLLEDFGIADQQELLSMSRRYEGLWNREEPLKPDEKLVLAKLLEDMFEQVLEADEVVKKSLNDNIKARVVTAFSMAPLLTAQEQLTLRVGMDRMNLIDRARTEASPETPTGREDWVMALIDEALRPYENGQSTTES